MHISERGIILIKYYESFRASPYRCSAGVPTIGWGNTFYENGRKVTLKDKAITKDRGEGLLRWVVDLFVKDVNYLLGDVKVKQHQFDALVSFAYNCGSDIDVDDIPEGLGDSTLLKLVKANPDDPRIVAEFLKWNRSGGKVVKGLVRRRTSEAHYYATGNLNLKVA